MYVLEHVDVAGYRRSRWHGLPWTPSTLTDSSALPYTATSNHDRVRSAADDDVHPHDRHADGRDRQEIAFGADSIRILGTRKVGIVGLSGGGSHVQQQLIHAGAGTLVVNDSEKVSATNPRRLVGSVATDVDVTDKVDIACRIAAAVRPEVTVIGVTDSFPAAAARAALRTCDLIIGCVDDWATRNSLNTFCLEHRIPYIDIGAVITPNDDGPRISGQVAVVLPGGPCLRDMGLVTDARVDVARQRALGYLENELEPQVVSINGTLASEAVTAALLLLTTSQAPVEAHRRYAYPPGKLVPVAAHRDELCRTCTQHGLR